ILSDPYGGSQLSFRVPLIVMSAYMQRGMVSNNRFDFGSILRFVEQNYGIQEGALTFADARSNTDLRGFFTLQRSPRTFQTINAPKGPDFFIHDPRPPKPFGEQWD